MRTHFPRINSTVLAVFLLVSLPALAAGVLLVLFIAQATLRDTFGSHLASVAEQTAAGVDAYVYRKVLDVSMLGRTRDIREAVQATPAADAARLATNSASRYLADLVAHDQVYREVVVTNRTGQLVASSRSTAPRDVSGDDWWKATVDDGVVGRVFVTQLRWDAAEGVSVMHVSAPVTDPASNQLVGVVRVVFDARELLAPVAGLQLGDTGMATLVRENGAVVFSRASNDPSATFFAAQELTDGLTRLSAGGGVREDGMHFSAAGADGAPYVVGVARSQLSRSFPNLAWLVAVSQAESELIGPVRSLGWHLLLVVLITVVLVLALALYFSMRLHAPPIDADTALVEHRPVSRMPDTGEDEADDDMAAARPVR
jgi:Cache domain